MMQQIQLHGVLADRFGELPPMDVRDPAEAMRALNSQLPGFGNVIRDGDWYVVIEQPDGNFALDVEAMQMGLGGHTLHILPAVQGAASQRQKGGVKAIIGVALIAASFFIPVVGTFVAMAGIAMAFAGAALMLAPQPAMPNQDEKPDTNSFIFNGNQKPSGQGLAVPCVFGEWRAVPIPVATRIETDQIMVYGGRGGPVVGNGGPTGSAYTNYPRGYDPDNAEGLSVEQWIILRMVAPWAIGNLS